MRAAGQPRLAVARPHPRLGLALVRSPAWGRVPAWAYRLGAAGRWAKITDHAKLRSPAEWRTILATSLLISASAGDARALALPAALWVTARRAGSPAASLTGAGDTHGRGRGGRPGPCAIEQVAGIAIGLLDASSIDRAVSWVSACKNNSPIGDCVDNNGILGGSSLRLNADFNKVDVDLI